MRLVRNLRLSLLALLAHRARSLLAGCGVSIGIAAVFLTSALAQGAQAELAARLGTMGTRLLVVRPVKLSKTPARRQIQGYASSLKLDDYDAIAELPGLAAAAPYAEGAIKLQAERGALATQVLGTTSNFFRVRHFELMAGRTFDDQEDKGTPRVAILGGRVARNLFPDVDVLGRDVRLGGAPFRVIGVLKSKGMSVDGSDTDGQVFVPIKTAMLRIFDSRSLSAVFVSVRHSEELARAQAAIRERLRERHLLDRRHRADDFTIQNQLGVLAAQQRITRPLEYFCAGLAALALLVGGVGILALMLLSVQERRWEIGLRLAVGATSGDIFVQFLTEALALAVIGGTFGVIMGTIGTWVVAQLTHWTLYVSPRTLLFSSSIAVGVGLIFGAVPARRAAQLPPARALTLE